MQLLPHQGADEVLRNADLALYRAKGEGKSCAGSFEPEMHVAALRRLELEAELRRAIDGEGTAGSLSLYYQPIARLYTGKMFGFEALVRWKHPERGILEPLDFISLAEETGLIIPLGRWVLGEVCRQAREWQIKFGGAVRGSATSMIVAVNLSGRHLAQPDLVNDVSDTLRKSGLAPSHLVLEMTESMLVHDNRATLERLHALKSLGVRLSIDDFGTGYSSLAYLERFPSIRSRWIGHSSPDWARTTRKRRWRRRSSGWDEFLDCGSWRKASRRANSGIVYASWAAVWARVSSSRSRSRRPSSSSSLSLRRWSREGFRAASRPSGFQGPAIHL